MYDASSLAVRGKSFQRRLAGYTSSRVRGGGGERGCAGRQHVEARPGILTPASGPATRRRDVPVDASRERRSPTALSRPGLVRGPTNASAGGAARRSEGASIRRFRPAEQSPRQSERSLSRPRFPARSGRLVRRRAEGVFSPDPRFLRPVSEFIFPRFRLVENIAKPLAGPPAHASAAASRAAPAASFRRLRSASAPRFRDDEGEAFRRPPQGERPPPRSGAGRPVREGWRRGMQDRRADPVGRRSPGPPDPGSAATIRTLGATRNVRSDLAPAQGRKA